MQHDWSDPTLPVAGGESVAALQPRVGAVLDELVPGQTTALVNRGDAIRAILAYAAQGLSTEPANVLNSA